MSPQDEANAALRIWQANRHLPPAHRLFLLGDLGRKPLGPANSKTTIAESAERNDALVSAAMKEPRR